MRIYSAIFFIFVLLSGCATFKELQPVPPLQSDERGYIELRNDEENFVLIQDNKYFIKFPGPHNINFYLALQTSAKHAVHNYLTKTFNDGQPPILPITDEAANQDSLSVFVIDTSIAVYYWVIDSVYQDTPLSVRYRYVPRWRFDVEYKYDVFKRILADNTIDRQEYEAMGPKYDFAAFDAPEEQQRLKIKNKALLEMKSDLAELEKSFPKNIAISRDTMYQRYIELGDDTKSELQFQTDYNTLLSVIQKERESKYNFTAFMSNFKEYEKFLNQKKRYRAPIIEHYKSVFVDRLEEAFPLYDNQLRKKDDISVIDLKPSLEDVENLYTACGKQVPGNLKEVRTYVDEFNIPAKWINNAGTIYEAASSAMLQKTPWPDNSYYPDLISKLEKARSGSPEYNLEKSVRYYNPKTNSLLSDGIQTIKQKVGERQAQFQRAADVVRLINELKPGNDYKGIVQILKSNRDLPFLIDQYSDVDALFMKSQADKVREQFEAQNWKGAEEGLVVLNDDQSYVSPSKISSKRLQTVQSLESDLFERVKKLTFERIDNFTKIHETTIGGVAELYADSSFLPVYTLTFSSESPERAAQKNRTIEAYINEIKTIRFPEKAIRNIYQELTKAPRDHGVEKAHSILAHAKFYKGQDKSIRNIIDECDPTIAKPLIKAKEYRRILVVPVNATAKSSNEYMFRINIKIPSEAKFPVYDINFKVPSVIAEKAGKTQWFTKILLNKKVVKTEGHMRIVAPSADNNYEAQITPVEISKTGENVIEVQFNYPSFQLFEVSVMAQVPIIRKH
jgi:hypothetical protein